MEKIAVISDIHGNIYALKAVLDNIDKESNINKIFCLGDLYTPYTGSNEVWKLLNKRKIPTIKGNGEERILKTLSNQNKSIRFLPTANSIQNLNCNIIRELKSLPISITIESKKVILCHGTPDNPYDFLIFNDGKLNNIVSKYKDYNIIAAHSHSFRSINKNGKLYCTIGSVGLAFNNKPTAEYSILEISDSGLKVQQKIVHYDNQLLLKEMIKSNFIRKNGPIGLLAFDEILSSKNRIYPFFTEYCFGKTIDDNNIYSECKTFLKTINRWEQLKQYFI